MTYKLKGTKLAIKTVPIGYSSPSRKIERWRGVVLLSSKIVYDGEVRIKDTDDEELAAFEILSKASKSNTDVAAELSALLDKYIMDILYNR